MYTYQPHLILSDFAHRGRLVIIMGTFFRLEIEFQGNKIFISHDRRWYQGPHQGPHYRPIRRGDLKCKWLVPQDSTQSSRAH